MGKGNIAKKHTTSKKGLEGVFLGKKRQEKMDPLGGGCGGGAPGSVDLPKKGEVASKNTEDIGFAWPEGKDEASCHLRRRKRGLL